MCCAPPAPLAGVLTLVLDAAKAWLAVWLADRLSGGSELWMSLRGAGRTGWPCVVHLDRIQRRERRWQVSSGAYAYLTPLPLLAVVLLFVFVVAWTRYLSLGSIIAAGLFPIACWMILHPALAGAAVRRLARRS